jgi:CubicO group peptidase (beta-lactamase class C family)
MVERGLMPSIVLDGEPNRTFALQDRMVHYDVPAASIAVIRHGRIAWAKAWGRRLAGTASPVTTDTQFEAASISKSVVAVATMRLVESGKLSIDGNVNQALHGWALPDAPAMGGQPVTLRQLLSHTGGISVSGFAGYVPGSPLPTLPEILTGCRRPILRRCGSSPDRAVSISIRAAAMRSSN